MAKNKAAEGQVTSRWYKSVSDYIYMAVIYIVLILALLLVLIPFLLFPRRKPFRPVKSCSGRWASMSKATR